MNGGDEVVAAPVGTPQPLDWKFSQLFGERTAGEEVQAEREGKKPRPAKRKERREKLKRKKEGRENIIV
jgi:hypothetical protein